MQAAISTTGESKVKRQKIFFLKIDHEQKAMAMLKMLHNEKSLVTEVCKQIFLIKFSVSNESRVQMVI